MWSCSQNETTLLIDQTYLENMSEGLTTVLPILK